jgi:hypothetical protein
VVQGEAAIEQIECVQPREFGAQLGLGAHENNANTVVTHRSAGTLDIGGCADVSTHGVEGNGRRGARRRRHETSVPGAA